MVLMNTLIVGLALFILVWIPSGTSELQKRQSQSLETTTTLVKIITELQNATGTTKELPTIASKPKTDDTNDNNNVEQKRTRGSTKYVDYAYSTTEPTKETSTITKLNLQQTKSARLTTVRNDRSLSLNTDKYNSPEFHSENKIYSETQTADNRYGIINRDKSTTEKTWEHMNFAEPDLTTPRNEVFDNKFRKLQEEITRSLNDVLTTERIPDEKYKETREGLPILMDLTTPKDELFDSRHKEMQEDLSKSLKTIDRFFNEKKVKEIPDNIEQPQLNDSKLDYTRYRRIEMNESKIMNMVRKDYNAESGTKMKHSSNYNNTQIIDAPGIVANTIPTQKDKGSIKKIDLDQGESVHEKITIEKPEKDPSMLINNKIENELINPLTTEGPEEKPFEHKSIYLSKRGSTIHSKEESVERSASTESGIPLDLYASKSPTPDLSRTSFSFNNADSDTFISKSVKKDKVLKKELEISQSDLDNKIPKFLPMTTQNIQIEISTEKPFKLEKLTEKNTGETLYEVNTSSTTVDVSTATEINVGVTIESFSTSETISVSDSSEATTASDFFEATDSTTLKTTINEDLTVSIESTVDNVNISESTTAKEKEEIATERTTSAVNTGYTSRDTETIDVTTLEITTESQNWKTDLMENILSSNNSRNEIITTSEHLNVNNTATENTETVETKETTEKSVFSRVTLAESNYTDLIKDTTTTKKNENVSNVINEITKSPNLTATVTNNEIPSTKSASTQWEAATENIIHNEEVHIKENGTKQQAENDQTKQNEINGDKLVSDECENTEESDDYGETNCKTSNVEESSDPEADLEDNSGHNQHPQGTENKQSTPAPLPSTLPHQTTTQEPRTTTTSRTTLASTTTIPATVTPITPDVRQTDITEPDVDTTARTDSIVSSEEDDDEDGGNGGKIAAIVISTIGGVCLLLLVALLIIMKKRQKRFNYGQRCRPVSLDAYSMDNVSIHNSTRRKGVLMTSKRSYGNPAFEDPTCPTHMLNISELLRFSNNQDGIRVEFEKIPQVTTKTNELPEGCDVKNRYANVIPLPETRVFLTPVEGIPSSDYINANYVTGPQGARHYYIACQAPMQNTIEDYWRMIWEQQSKVVLMMTHLYENGVEKCIDYLPPSEVLDCHRLFGDFQITLKKREVKDKYIISSLQLKNMISNSWREVTHLWYMGWPEKGVPEEANSLIAFLIEARSCMKTGDNKVKETNNMNISNGLNLNSNPVVVHCSPGTGRTGTVIACDIAIREFELTRKVDIPKIVYRIRRDRASAVQTKEQYSFIYKVIHFYATKLTGGAFETF